MTSPDAPSVPNRMTLSRVVELLLQRGSAERSYVTLTRNAKGETQIDVKVQTTELGDITSVEDAEARAVAVYDRLRAMYPAESGAHEQTTVSLTRNAKGETQVDVQVRSGDDGAVQTGKDVANAVIELYDRMRARYPMLDGRTAAAGTVAKQ